MRERDAFEPPGFHEADGSLVRERAPTWRMRKIHHRWPMTQLWIRFIDPRGCAPTPRRASGCSTWTSG